MRHSNLGRLLGLGLMLLLLGALPATAAATPSTLCKENVTNCSIANSYPSGTTVEATLKSGTEFSLKNNAFFSTALKCTSSTIKGETTSGLGDLKLTSWTFGGCKQESSEICQPTANNLPANGAATATEGGNGTLTLSSGGSGNPGFKMTKCTFGVTCVYSTGATPISLQGGNPATIVASNVQLNYESGSGPFVCGSTVTWNATYSVTSPKPLFVTHALRPTVLCNTSSTDCSAEHTLASGTTISGSGSGVEFEMHDSLGSFEKCGSTSIGLKSEAESGEPLPLEETSLKLSECSGFCSTITATGLPYKGSEVSAEASGNGKDGTIKAPFALTFSNCQLGATCEFRSPGGSSQLKVTGGSTATILANEASLAYKSGSGESTCGSTAKITALWSVSSPSPLFLTNT